MNRSSKRVVVMVMYMCVVFFVMMFIYLANAMYDLLPVIPDNQSIFWWRDVSSGHYILRHKCNDRDVVCDTCCYCYYPSLHIMSEFGDLSQDELAKRQCEKRLPQSIIIGAMKSGTYALRTFLSYHPDIAMAFDEPWFWNNEFEYKMGLESYRHMMHYSTPGQVTMEKTPNYYQSDDAPKRISGDLPNDVKIIMIMNDPVKRAISHYNFIRLRKQQEDFDFPATFEQAVLKNNTINEHSPYIALSRYSTYIRQWLDYFPPERFLAVDGDSFLRDPLAELQRVEKYLHIRPFFTHNIFVKNPTSGLWCLTAPILTCVPQSEPHPPHPKVSDTFRKRLYLYFKPYNQQLSNMLEEPAFEWILK